MNEKGFFDKIEPDNVQRKLNHIPVYLRFLSASKMIIGVLVLLLIAVVVIVPFLKTEDEGLRIAMTQPIIGTGNAEKPLMKSPRFESVDGDGQPFTIRALEAVQQDESRIDLHEVSADVALNSGLWLALSAKSGELDMESQKMRLREKVHIIASNGYEFSSPEIFVDMKKNEAKSNSGIDGQGPIGSINSDNFLIEGDSQRLLFENNVKLVIYP